MAGLRSSFSDWSILGPEQLADAGRNEEMCLGSADWYLDLSRTKATAPFQPRQWESAARVLGLRVCLVQLVVSYFVHLPNPVLPFLPFLYSKESSRI